MADRMSTNEVRQGQSIKGMIWVLVIGIAAVVIGFIVMLAFSAQPVTVDNQPAPPAYETLDVAAPTPNAPAETQ